MLFTSSQSDVAGTLDGAPRIFIDRSRENSSSRKIVPIDKAEYLQKAGG